MLFRQPPALERLRHRDGWATAQFQRGKTLPPSPPALPARRTHVLELSDLLPTLYSFMAFS